MSVGDELALEIAELAARLDAAMHRMLECIRQFDTAEAWSAQGALSCAHWLSWRIGLDLGTAREKVRVARALGALPAIDGALAAGKVSYAKVRAMTRVATPQNEGRLLELALHATGAQLERICRGYRRAAAGNDGPQPEARGVWRRLLPGGRVKLEMVLEPDEADLVLRAIDCGRDKAVTKAQAPTAVSEETGPPPSRADGAVAMAEACLASATASSHGGDRYQVVVHVDQDVLAPDGTLAATLEDGTQVSAESLRRIACDCGMVGASGSGAALALGRRTRSISPALRRALNLRAHGCEFPGCAHDRFLHAHHVRHWLHGGETNLQNLLHLCSRHHRMVHEDGWRVDRGEEGGWRFVAPTGADTVPAARDWGAKIQGMLQDWADEHDLDIGPDTNEPGWDGRTPDYDVAVAGLFG